MKGIVTHVFFRKHNVQTQSTADLFLVWGIGKSVKRNETIQFVQYLKRIKVKKVRSRGNLIYLFHLLLSESWTVFETTQQKECHNERQIFSVLPLFLIKMIFETCGKDQSHVAIDQIVIRGYNETGKRWRQSHGLYT